MAILRVHHGCHCAMMLACLGGRVRGENKWVAAAMQVLLHCTNAPGLLVVQMVFVAPMFDELVKASGLLTCGQEMKDRNEDGEDAHDPSQDSQSIFERHRRGRFRLPCVLCFIVAHEAVGTRSKRRARVREDGEPQAGVAEQRENEEDGLDGEREGDVELDNADRAAFEGDGLGNFSGIDFFGFPSSPASLALTLAAQVLQCMGARYPKETGLWVSTVGLAKHAHIHRHLPEYLNDPILRDVLLVRIKFKDFDEYLTAIEEA